MVCGLLRERAALTKTFPQRSLNILLVAFTFMYAAIAVSLLVLCRGDALWFNYAVVAYFSFILVFLLGATLHVVGACTHLLSTIASATAVAAGGHEARVTSLEDVAGRVRKIRLAFAALMACLLIILLPFEVTYLVTGMAPYVCVYAVYVCVGVCVCVCVCVLTRCSRGGGRS